MRLDQIKELERLKRLEKEKVPKNDPVNNPLHYNRKGVECIQAIEASMSAVEFKGYLKGNAIKYLWRYSYKHAPVEDLAKSVWYSNKLQETINVEK